MVNWEPIPELALLARISQGYARMIQAHQRLWNAIRINPEKWQQHPYGDAGGGFWTVGLIGRTAIWYNDREDGFNRSVYSTYGLIDDYWCNHDELDVTVQYLANVVSGGQDLSQIGSRFKKRA
jgi:hypothetical protein